MKRYEKYNRMRTYGKLFKLSTLFTLTVFISLFKPMNEVMKELQCRTIMNWYNIKKELNQCE